MGGREGRARETVKMPVLMKAEEKGNKVRDGATALRRAPSRSVPPPVAKGGKTEGRCGQKAHRLGAKWVAKRRKRWLCVRLRSGWGFSVAEAMVVSKVGGLQRKEEASGELLKVEDV